MGPKKKEQLPTVFQCLFCNHEKSVTVKLDRKAGIGYASCKVCGQSHQCPITFLDQAVDVYANWVDAAEAVNQGGEDAPEGAEYAHVEQEVGYRGTARGKGTTEEGGGGGYDADDGFVVEDELDGEAEYEDAE